MLDLTIMAAVQNGLNAVAVAHEALVQARTGGLDAQADLLAAETRKKEKDAATIRAEANFSAAKRDLAAAIDGAFPSAPAPAVVAPLATSPLTSDLGDLLT